MRAVDLDDRLDDPLLDRLHAVEFLVKNTPGLDGIDGFEIIVLPLDVHHDGEGALGVPSLLRGDLVGAGDRQVAAGPQADIVRQSAAGTFHKIGDALQTGQLHPVSGLIDILIGEVLGGGIGGQQALDHKLQEAVLRGELGLTAESRLADLVDSIAVRTVLSGEAHADPVLAEPLDEAGKPGVNAQHIRLARRLIPLRGKGKGSALGRTGKHAVRVMAPFLCSIVQNEDGILRAGGPLVRTKHSPGTDAAALGGRHAGKIKNRHRLNSLDPNNALSIT